MDLSQLKVLIRGAGEMASGTAVRLHNSGFRVVMTEIEAPLCVRRLVSFSEAVHHGRMEVEGAAAKLAADPGAVFGIWEKGDMAVIVDPDLTCLDELRPDVLVDAILAKRNTGLRPGLAELTAAMGPGFAAPADADVVLETNRGHNLGRLIYEGEAEPNTGVPGDIVGQTGRRVLRAPTDGVLTSDLDIGAMVKAGQKTAEVDGRPVEAELDGVLRGLIRPGTPVAAGIKVGDVDPRGRVEYCSTVSEKARAIGGSVLEAILHRFNR